MMQRLWCLLVVCVLALSFAAAEDTQLPPILVDRVNAPEEYADFAFAEDAELLEVIFPQILNCDAVFLRCGGETMLVDCATQGQAVRIINMCKQLGITRIDRVINTHPHEDHIGGFRDLIKAVEVGELWICFPADYNDHMKKAVGYAEKAGIPVKTYADGDVLTLGGATVDVWKLDGTKAEMNDCSAQFYIKYGERTLLMAADLEKAGQTKMTELKDQALDADMLKYPHHGIDKLTPEYQAAVSPVFMVITNNLRKTEGYYAITKGDVPYAYTVPNLVHLTTDGQTWVAEKVLSDVKY